MVRLIDVKKRVIISSQRPGGLESLVDPRLGRCNYYTVVKIMKNKFEEEKVIINQAKRALNKAGHYAAKNIIKLGADLVITGRVESNLLKDLQKFGILIAISSKVKVAIKNYLNGKLPIISRSNSILSFRPKSEMSHGQTMNINLETDNLLV